MNALLLAALTGPAPASGPASEAVAAASIERWESAFNAGEFDSLANFYTDRAILVPPTQEIVADRSAIREFWEAKREAGTREFRVDPINTRVEGNRVYQTAVWSATLLVDGRPGRFDGEMTSVLVRQPDGVWRIELQNWY